jgi:TolA-binding protein
MLSLAGGALLLLTGCSGVAEVTGTASQDDVLQLRTDVVALQRALQRARADQEAALALADRRAREQAAASDQQLATMARRLDGLATTLAEVTARLDTLSARLDGPGRQPRAAAAPPIATARPVPTVPAPAGPPATATSPTTGPSTAVPPTATPVPVPPSTATPVPTPPAATTMTPRPAPVPPASPGTAAAAIPAVPGAPATATPAVPATPAPTPTPATPGVATSRPTTGALQPNDIYQAAYIDFSKGSYPLAMAGFREFLRRFPEHDLADNAQYWIAESHLAVARGHANASQPEPATQELEQAVLEFRKVVANYPRGDKAPSALYKEALALIELKQPQVAAARLQYLVDNFPQAEETPLARERLAALKN